MPSAFRVGILLWAPTDANHRGEPLELALSMFVCEQHRENPPQSAPEMLSVPESRQRIAAGVLAMGYAAPDFDSATYHFDPLPPLTREAAH